MISQGIVEVAPVTSSHRNKPHCYIEILNIMLVVKIWVFLCFIAVKMTESRSKSLPADKQHKPFGDYSFSSGLKGAKSTEKGAHHKKIDANCPKKEPKSGDPCPDEIKKNSKITCPFKNLIYSCYNKQWVYSSSPPAPSSGAGKIKEAKSKNNGTDGEPKNDKNWHNTITWNGVSCPSKEPKVGDACKHKGLKCPFKTKEGNKTFTCPDKKWEASALGVPLFVNAKGCPKKAPQIKKPCSKPESLRCSYPDVTMGEGCPPLEHKCMKGKDGKKIWVDEGVC